MYEIIFELGGKKLIKTAKTEAQVKKLVFTYGSGNSNQKMIQYNEIISKGKKETKIKSQDKSEKNEHL